MNASLKLDLKVEMARPGEANPWLARDADGALCVPEPVRSSSEAFVEHVLDAFSSHDPSYYNQDEQLRSRTSGRASAPHVSNTRRHGADMALTWR